MSSLCDAQCLDSKVLIFSVCRIGESMRKPDRNHYTPIVSALVSHEYKRITKDESVKVVFEILSYLSTSCTDCTKCIEAIKDAKYRGLPVIEYDIKSGQGIIIQVSSIGFILKP